MRVLALAVLSLALTAYAMKVSIVASPRTVCEGRNVNLYLDVEDGGGWGEIRILRGGDIVDIIPVSSIRNELLTQWSGRSGEYTASARICGEGCGMNSTEFRIVPCEIYRMVPPGQGTLKIHKYPILSEVSAGESTVLSIVVEGEGNYDVNVSGPSWIYSDANSVKLSGEGGINLAVSPGIEDVGDHLVTLRIGGEEIKFLVRVLEQSMCKMVTLSRNVEADDGGIVVWLNVKNRDERALIELVEGIPREISDYITAIQFIHPPNLPRDMIHTEGNITWLKWILQDLAPCERRSVAYKLSPMKTPEDYTKYVYWPVRQTNVFYVYENVSIEMRNLTFPMLIAGRGGQAEIEIANVGDVERICNVQLSAPEGWGVIPPSASFSIPPHSSRTMSFRILPPVTAPPGEYSLAVSIRYDGEETSRSFVVSVEQDYSPMIYATVACMLVILLSYARRRYIEARRRETMMMLREIGRRIR